jgi:hypothetical protein
MFLKCINCAEFGTVKYSWKQCSLLQLTYIIDKDLVRTSQRARCTFIKRPIVNIVRPYVWRPWCDRLRQPAFSLLWKTFFCEWRHNRRMHGYNRAWFVNGIPTRFEWGCGFHGCDRNRFMCDATSPFLMESYQGGLSCEYNVSSSYKGPYHWFEGHAVAQLVQALPYMSESRRLDSRWCYWNFALTLTLPAALWPWGWLSL